jgi:hypothetical protein
LFADGVAIGEDEHYVEAVLHQNFSQSFELVFILRGHDSLAIIKYHQQMFFSELFCQAKCLLASAAIGHLRCGLEKL